MSTKSKTSNESNVNYPYAVICAGGKQFRVSEGDQIVVEKLELNPGQDWNCEEVLLVAKGPGDVSVGQPTVKGAKVKCEVLQQTLGDKLLIRYHRRRHNSQKTIGHRQPLTRLVIKGVSA